MSDEDEPIQVVVADPDAGQRQDVVNVVKEAARDLDLNIQIHEVADGTTAGCLCEKHRPALMICEVLLEGISGLSLLRRLQTSGQPTAVIFVTSMGRDTDRYWGLRNGAHAYLPKPYDPGQLRLRVARLLQQGTAAPAERPHL